MKLLKFFAATYCATFSKVSLKYLANEGDGDNFLGLILESSKFSNPSYGENGAKLQYISKFFYVLLLLAIFYHNDHVWMEIVVQV